MGPGNAQNKPNQVLVNRVLQLLIDSIESDESLIAQFKAIFIHPLNTSMYPYFIVLVVLISIALIVNLTTCMLFIMISYRRR